ncbi:hypothetical protein B0A81_04705 [Flavobacterium plurextorum]|uniref:Uncharacterized protein n=1 Tax=Flavobacterium plurextorum TaxID=1114867 RepID=A0ABX4CXJ3_9FLAO|nr:hypothetical protein [Flavobacterium plurextorum]OXB09942.1 hypothetical protein B0A81_04705 [Flavobacterium plurextorum]
MNKKIYLILAIPIVLFSAYYYWENRYVELRPVIPKEYTRQLIFFDNDLYKIAKPNEVSPKYYKNIKFVLDRSSQEYIIKKGLIYVKFKYMHDMNLMWNYTTRATDPTWFNLKREMDSINGNVKGQREMDSIIKTFNLK